MDTDYTREEMLRLAASRAGIRADAESIVKTAETFTDFVKLSKKERKRRNKLSEGKVDMARDARIGLIDLHPEVLETLKALSEAVDQLQTYVIDKGPRIVPATTDFSHEDHLDAAQKFGSFDEAKAAMSGFTYPAGGTAVDDMPQPLDEGTVPQEATDGNVTEGEGWTPIYSGLTDGEREADTNAREARGYIEGWNEAIQAIVNLQETHGLTHDSSVSVSQVVTEIGKLRK